MQASDCPVPATFHVCGRLGIHALLPAARPRHLMKFLVGVVLPIVLLIVVFAQFLRPPIPEPPPGPELSDSATTPEHTPPDGTWGIVQEDSYVGYRIVERDPTRGRDNEAVGRTTSVAGQLEVERGVVGDATVTADLERLTSDQRRRDRAIRVRYLESRQYPDATFTVTEPFAPADGLADGHVVTHRVAGVLEIRGLEQDVVADLQARWDGEQVTVVGAIPIALDDYGVRPPQIWGFRMVEDTAEIELLLHFAPEGSALGG
jgi:polyisoprenoid-binding protein YceI